MKVNLIVLYVADLDRSRDFYATLLGRELVRKQHGDGPVHYSATIDGTILELYPAPVGGPVTKVRLGFACGAAELAVARLRKAGFTVKRSNLVVDPDGNRAELLEQPGWDAICGYEPDPDDEEKTRIRDLLNAPDRPVILTGVEYPPDSPQGRQLTRAHAAAEWRVLRHWSRPEDTGTQAELREQALARMQAWLDERLAGEIRPDWKPKPPRGEPR